MVIGRNFLLLISFSLIFISDDPLPCLATNAPSRDERVTIRHHDLFVQLSPDSHALIGQDRITLIAEEAQKVRLSLAPTLTVSRIAIFPSDRQPDDVAHDVPFEIEHGPTLSTQFIIIPSAVIPAGSMSMTIFYQGTINDPPKEPRHLRFVTPSETAGHIGSEGVYLSSESQWYPDISGSLSTYALRLAMPEGWTAVTQAKVHRTKLCASKECAHAGLQVSEWDPTQPSEALTLVANRFAVKTREWTARAGQPVQLAAYLFPENAQLADEYLDAAIRYLDAYIPLLGPYPFETFAVVENFFSSGLGMPSFTLLGSAVIKRRYIQPYALGHEIVHSWIGNTVFNRVERGNWVEGLTTYLSNYYWHELTGDWSQARDQRELFVRGYNLHVPPDRDYPVGEFRHKHDERDNAIGYQKAAMVFHLLRQEIGDKSFWPALKRLVAQYRGSYAEWGDLERVFADTSGRDLRWFFEQWIEQSGAPSLSVTGAIAHVLTHGAAPTFSLDVTIQQSGKSYRVPVQLQVKMEDGRTQTVPVPLSDNVESITLGLPARPTEVALDPDAMLVRRIARQALPPVLNHYVTDSRRSLIQLSQDISTGPHPFHELVKRIVAQDERKSESERTLVLTAAEQTLLPREGSVLVLGGVESRAAIQSLIGIHCGDLVRVDDRAVLLNGVKYQGAGTALLASCHRAQTPGSVVTLLYAMTPQAVSTVSRLVFFYGWNSFVVFKDGAVTTRGDWPVIHSPSDRMEVQWNDQDVAR